MVLESKGDATLQAILKLLRSLFDSTVITVDQMRRVRRHRLVTAVLCYSYHLLHMRVRVHRYSVVSCSVFYPDRATRGCTWISLTSTSTCRVRTPYWSTLWTRASAPESLTKNSETCVHAGQCAAITPCFGLLLLYLLFSLLQNFEHSFIFSKFGRRRTIQH